MANYTGTGALQLDGSTGALLLESGTGALLLDFSGAIPYAFPVPAGQPYPVALRTFLGPYRAHLIGQDQFFGLAGHPNFDQPNPVLPRDRGAAMRSQWRVWQNQHPTLQVPHVPALWVGASARFVLRASVTP